MRPLVRWRRRARSMTATIAQPDTHPTPALGAAPCILVVDKQPISRELVRRILAAEGFRTLLAEDGDQALRQLSAPVDLVLLDAILPDQSGFQVCARLKADRRLGDIPVIFFSALDDPAHRLQGLRAGGVDYISKPFHAEEVLARVRIHLRTRHAMQCMARQQQALLAELRDAQRAILVLPEDLPQASFAVCYRPLDAVGGDIYEVLELGDRLFGYFVADVSGHSVGASFLTSAIKVLLRQFASPVFSAEDAMRGINRAMQSTVKDGQYLTACYARYYQRERLLTFVSAGHPSPIHVSAGRACTFALEGDPLGAFPSVVLEKKELRAQPGDRFYLYTDGLIEDPELPGGGRNAGLQRLAEACERRHGLPLAAAADAIVGDVRPENEPARDDLLLLAVEVNS